MDDHSTKPKMPVASVATGFPSGQYSLSTRLEEIRRAVADGATEIDIVISRSLALSNNWQGKHGHLFFEDIIVFAPQRSWMPACIDEVMGGREFFNRGFLYLPHCISVAVLLSITYSSVFFRWPAFLLGAPL